jgi:hypothetical protein
MRSSILTLAILSLVFWTGQAPAFGQDAGGGGTKENLDLPFDAIGASEDEEEAPEIIVFYGQQYEGDGIFFCCDKSGSMNEANKFRRLQQEVAKNLTQFSERVQFGIVFFDAGLSKFPPSGRPAEANPSMKAAGMAYVMSTTPGHGTCCKAALTTALTYANQATSKRKLIIYLSDGYTTCPGQDATQYGQATLAEVTARNTSRIHINTICIGPQGGVDENWMRKLAAQNNGSYARIVQ